MIFETPTQFCLFIEESVKKSGLSYLEQILEYCDDNAIDPDDIGKLITPTFREKIRSQATEKYSMPKRTTYTLE